MSYIYETEVSTDLHDFEVKFTFEVEGENIPEVLYPNDQAQPAEYAQIAVTRVQIKISSGKWADIEDPFFYNWAETNEDYFWEFISD